MCDCISCYPSDKRVRGKEILKTMKKAFLERAMVEVVYKFNKKSTVSA